MTIRPFIDLREWFFHFFFFFFLIDGKMFLVELTFISAANSFDQQPIRLVATGISQVSKSEFSGKV